MPLVIRYPKAAMTRKNTIAKYDSNYNIRKQLLIISDICLLRMRFTDRSKFYAKLGLMGDVIVPISILC